jgi:IS30 family transposase
LKSKDKAYKAIDHFIAAVQTQYKKRVMAFMTDAGGEYKSLCLTEKFKELGILIYQSVPHMPQQNGHAERFNRTYMEKAESMRHQACLPRSLWEFTIEYAIHVYNHTPVKRLKNKTPFEMLNSVKPDLSHLRIMGCGAYVFLHEDVRHDKFLRMRSS